MKFQHTHFRVSSPGIASHCNTQAIAVANTYTPIRTMQTLRTSRLSRMPSRLCTLPNGEEASGLFSNSHEQNINRNSFMRNTLGEYMYFASLLRLHCSLPCALVLFAAVSQCALSLNRCSVSGRSVLGERQPSGGIASICSLVVC